MAKHDHVTQKLTQESLSASELVKFLQSDDEALTHDMVEGETDLFEAVQVALDAITDCEVIIDGITTAEKRMSERKDRAKRRAETLRGLIDQAFQMADIQSHVFPTATITTKRVPPKLIVTEEASIPSRFYEPQPPKLDKKAVFDAIKAGVDVPGAEKSNGGTTIQIRRT